MKHSYKNIVFGATVYAAGLSSVMSHDTLLVECGETLATDYVSCINKLTAKFNLRNSAVDNLYDKLNKRNLISDSNIVNIYPLEGICAEYFHNVDVLLNTSVCSIEKAKSEYSVLMYNDIDGYFSVKTTNIIDTTPIGVFEEYASYNYNKYLCAEVASESCGDYPYLISGRFDGEYAFGVKVDKLCSYHNAVAELHKKWKETHCKGQKITSVAAQFAYSYNSKVKQIIDDNYLFVPSCSHRSIDDAVGEGIYAAQLYK